MRCPTLQELPPPPPGKTGWPWTEAAPRVESGPRISILTPSFQQGEFIEQTIRSVLLQGYPDIEYFVLDGGSTDGTRAIIEKYAPWLSGWRSERDSGQSAAINEGWKRARGELLMWINSDDWLHPGAFAALSQAAVAHPDIHWFSGAVDDVLADGTFLKRHPARAMTLPAVLGRHDYAYAQPGMAWRRTLVEKIAPFDESLHNVFDHDYWVRSQIAGFTLHPLDTSIASFRLHAVSKTGGNFARSIREDKEVFHRHAHSLPADDRRQAAKWLRAYEADGLIPATYKLLAAHRRVAAIAMLARGLRVWPAMPQPRAYLGAWFRALSTGRPPAWFQTSP